MAAKPLECPNCARKFNFDEAEQHEATMTVLVIGCPRCSSPLTYQRTEGEY